MFRAELFHVACHCLVLDEQPELVLSLKEKFESGKVDIYKFIHLCSNHLVLPVIYRKLKDAGILEYFPKDFVSHIHDIYILNKKRNKEILTQSDVINLELKKEGITPIYLKGTAHLMDDLYPFIGDRLIGDIDLLVRDKDYLKTSEVVLKLGYICEYPLFDDVTKIEHFPRLYKSGEPADVEIHRVPVKIEYSKRFSAEINFANKKWIQTRENCYVQCDEHKVIHNFIHSQLSNSAYKLKTASLRDIYDLYLLSKRINFDDIIPQIENKRKAKNYFEFSTLIFASGNSQTLYNRSNTNKYYRQFNWFLNHPKQHLLFINFLKATDIFIERPIKKIKNAIRYKAFRNDLYNRISNRRWYKMIYEGIKDQFTHNSN